MTGPFIQSEPWRALVEDQNAWPGLEHVRALEASDLQDLVALFATSFSRTGTLAFQILWLASQRAGDLPALAWPPGARRDFMTAVADRNREYYEGSRAWREPGGSSIRVAWSVMDTEACMAYLLSRALAELQHEVQAEALQTLAAQARKNGAVLSHVQRLADEGGALGVAARDALEYVGIVSDERLQFWSRRWREERDPRALEWLAYRWLDYLPVGYPTRDLLRVLGPPSDGELPDIYYTTEGGHVYIEAFGDQRGYRGCHHA